MLEALFLTRFIFSFLEVLVYEVFKKLISTWIYGFVVWDSDEVEDACTCFLWCCCKEFQCWERQKIMGSSYR